MSSRTPKNSYCLCWKCYTMSLAQSVWWNRMGKRSNWSLHEWEYQRKSWRPWALYIMVWSLLKLEGFSPIHDLFQRSTCRAGWSAINVGLNQVTTPHLPFIFTNTSLGHGHQVDLADCLRYYTKDEILTGEKCMEMFKCSKKHLQSTVFQY